MKLIIGILILILLVGCGIFNLTNWIMPDDQEFIELIESLNTPKKIGDYMVQNFHYKFKINSISPYILWKTQKGDCNDFAVFGMFIANYHNYETYQMIINYGSIFIHVIAVYKEDRLSFTDNQKYYYGFDSFEEIAIESCKHIGKELKSFKVYDFRSRYEKLGCEGGICPPPEDLILHQK